MVDYSQFEASVKSGIHADASRIRQKDEIIKAVVKKRRSSAIICVCFLCMAGISLFKSWIPAVICFLLALFFLWRAVGKFSDEYLREMYEEGLLVPGMIVKTEPLTIMAIANMTARDGAATVNGCYCLEMKELDGAQKTLFEKIPCSCFFCYEGGNYHSSFQPHPLYWGTADQQSIQEALRQVEEDNKENTRNEWEVDTVDEAIRLNPKAHLLFHSDRGFQYTNRVFHSKLTAAGITQSMSRVGKCIDNDPMEGFWGILKRERYYGKRFKDKETLVKMIEDYIDYYNNKRLQRGFGVLTPTEKQEIHLQVA